MRKNMTKLLAFMLVMVICFSSVAYASSSVSTKADKNGYYTIATTDKLNITGATAITLPMSFDKDVITTKYFEKNGVAVSATLKVAKNLLTITPKSQLVANTTYTVKLTAKSKKKYLMNIVTKNATMPAPTPAIVVDENGFYELKTNGYLNAVEESTIKLPVSLKNKDIEGTSIVNNGEFVSANINIDNDIMSITPSEYFMDGKSYEVRIFTSDKNYSTKLQAYNIKSLDSKNDHIYKIPPNPEKGFNYPYYLYVPVGADRLKRMIVETNNSVMNDNMEFHDEQAYFTVQYNMAGYVAANLRLPLVVPILPKPLDKGPYKNYQSLTRDVMLEKSGDSKRIDLQLVAMIKDAQSTLKKVGLTVDEKVFMTGFSASGQFAQRFTILHPEIVKALFSQGTSTLPTEEWQGRTLRYPVGVSDIKELTGKDFNIQAYNKVAKFLFMNDKDTNDGSHNRDMFEEQDGKLIRELIGEKVFPDRWNNTQKIMIDKGFGASTQFNTYKGASHEYPQTMYPDMLDFFMSNMGDKMVKIKAHENAFDNNWYQDVMKVLKKWELR